MERLHNTGGRESQFREGHWCVQVSGDLKVSKQCAMAARTAMAVVAQILRAFSYRDRRVLPRLYVQYVRP